MKTLYQIQKEIENLQDEILCQKIGNDFYYTSPLYRLHFQRLSKLHAQKNALKNQNTIQKCKKNKNYTGQA